MDEQKEILQYFNLYYYFGQLTQNAYQIKHAPYALKNKSKIIQDIESFYKKKNEDKHITKKLISISIDENGELSKWLLQNLTYHINSLYVNKYNQSEIYFDNVQKEITTIMEDKAFLTWPRIQRVKTSTTR